MKQNRWFLKFVLAGALALALLTAGCAIKLGGKNTHGSSEADFEASCVGLTCVFVAKAVLTDEEIARYDWDLGDGNMAEGRVVDWTYVAPGDYAVNLTVTGEAGATVTKGTSVMVEFTDSPPGLLWEKYIPGKGLGMWIELGPFYADGFVYVVTHRYTHDNDYSYVHAIHADTGEQVWEASFSGFVRSMVVGEGRVYVWDPGERLVVFAADDGTRLWSKEGMQSPHVTRMDGAVFLQRSNGDITAFNAEDGGDLWSFEHDRGSRMIADDGVLYVMNEDRLTSLDADDGSLIWDHQAAHKISSMQAGHDLVYVSGDDGQMVAFDRKNGSMVWQRELDAPVTSVLASTKHIHVGTESGEVIALSAADGSVSWRAEVFDQTVSFAEVDHRVVLLRNETGHLVALDIQDGGFLWDTSDYDPLVWAPLVSDGVVYIESDKDRLYALSWVDGSLILEGSFDDHARRPIIHQGVLFYLVWELSVNAFDTGLGEGSAQ